MNFLINNNKISQSQLQSQSQSQLQTQIDNKAINESESQSPNKIPSITNISSFFKEDNTNLIILTSSIFLLYLSLSTGFLTPLLGCQIFRLTKNNIYFRHLILLLFIYFIFDITATFQNYVNPLYTFFLAFCIYVLFILFSKMTLFYTLLVLGLIVIIAIINKFKRYYNHELSDNEKKLQSSLEYLNNIENIFIILIMISILIGSITYYLSKKQKYKGNKFSYLIYFFGALKCRGKE